MIGHCGKLEVLHAGRLDPPPAMDLEGLQKVLAAARAQYEVICADLPSSLDSFSIALLKESRKDCRFFVQPTRTTSSVGVTFWRIGETAEELIARADAAMHQGKAQKAKASKLASKFNPKGAPAPNGKAGS
jgi:hypothetical protein